MVELDQFRYRISGYDKPMAQIKNSLDLDNKQKRIEELEADMESPGFWDNPDQSRQTMQVLKSLQDSVKQIEQMYSDGESDYIGNQNNPSVTINGVRLILPAQNHPKNQGSKKRRESIYFSLYCAEPESITKSICQSSYQPGTENDNHVGY